MILGIESQEYIHYAMPMRVMGYDYGSYKKQYDSNAKQYQTADGLDENEYLSKMKKTDRFTPVITAVLYYGSKTLGWSDYPLWDAQHSGKDETFC